MPLGIHPTRAGGCVHEVTNGRPDEVCGEVGLCLLPGAATLALASQEWLARETFFNPDGPFSSQCPAFPISGFAARKAEKLCLPGTRVS